MSQIKKDTVIKHPLGGVVTLQEIQNDVWAAQKAGYQSNDFCFTYLTVQSLVDKIEELQKSISQTKHANNIR